jgi:hypothetical protein
MNLFVCSVKKSNIDTLLKENINVLELNILLRGGKYIWNDDDCSNYSHEYIINEYLEPNGIYHKEIWTDKYHKENIYIIVDSSNTIFNDFYTDLEIKKDDEYTLCWKKIYIFLNKSGQDFLGTDISYFNHNLTNNMFENFIKYIFDKYIKST